MNKEQAMRHLNASGLFGNWYRRAAIRTLTYTPGLEPILVLAKALIAEHPNAVIITEILKRLAPNRDEDRIAALWQLLAANPKPILAIILTKLGWPPGRTLKPRLAKSLLALVTPESDPAILQAVEGCVSALPEGDEEVNDALYSAWVASQSGKLEQFIGITGRQPGNPALEALHALVTGQLSSYMALENQDGELLAHTVQLAPPAFLERISETIATCAEPKLRNLYRSTLFRANINSLHRLENMKLIGDEEGLFEQVQMLRLGQVLELCERWLEHSDWATKSSQKLVIAQVLVAYQQLKTPQQSSGPALPDGMVDLFTYWNDGFGTPNKYYTDNPIARARSMYINYRQNTGTSPTAPARPSEHWLERLIIYLADISNLLNAQDDPVYLVTVCAHDAALLQTPILGTPEDYSRHIRLLEEIQGPINARTLGLLVILCVFQGTFIGTGITVETLREPTECTAIELEDYIEQNTKIT